MNTIEYVSSGAESLDEIAPLWAKLNQFHSRISPHFNAVIQQRTFGGRKDTLLAKSRSGELRIDIARLRGARTAVGYCVSSVDSNGNGEIDSLFVEETYRGRGIGQQLMRSAIGWMDDLGAINRRVVVTAGNDGALKFYAQFGFHPYNSELRHKAADAIA